MTKRDGEVLLRTDEGLGIFFPPVVDGRTGFAWVWKFSCGRGGFVWSRVCVDVSCGFWSRLDLGFLAGRGTRSINWG